MVPRPQTLVSPLVLAVLAGCSATVEDPAPRGELTFAVSDGADLGREATFDFGEVLAGGPAGRSILVRNIGRATLTLGPLEKVAGDGIRIRGAGDADAPFRSDLDAARLLPGELAEIVAYHPGPVAEPTVHEIQLRLTVEGAAPGEETGTLTLVGTALPFDCDLPPELDFGAVAVGDAWNRSFALHNPTSSSLEVRIDAITSSVDVTAFSFAGIGPGTFTILPRSVEEVPVSFQPKAVGSFSGSFTVQPAKHCPVQTIGLTGRGVDQVLTWAPAFVDCGYVTPGTEVVRELSFSNLGSADVELSNIRLANTSQFGIAAAGGGDPTSLTVPAGASAKLNVVCRPNALGPRSTSLQFQTNLASLPTGAVLVRVEGGGPDIDVSGGVDFGDVAYFAGASASVHRMLMVRNVGTPPASGSRAGNLRLGITDASGNVIPNTYFSLTPATDFEVSVPTGYDAQEGVGAVPGANLVEVRVDFRPTSLGSKTAELAIYSNDQDERIVKVQLAGNAITLPPCQYSVAPATLDFGLVPPPETRERVIRVKNEGTQAADVCLLYGAQTVNASSPHLSVTPELVDTTREIPAGGFVDVTVRARPRTTTPITDVAMNGTLELQLSSPSSPTANVPLTGTVGPGCLLIAPSAFDFGDAQVGCSAATRTFNLHNQCATSLAITGVRVLSAPGSDPLCASSGCTFSITSAPSLPAGGLVLTDASAPVPLQLRFRPGTAGRHFDAVEVDVAEGSRQTTVVVPLDGTGSQQSARTDSFALPATPAADVLIVMEDATTLLGVTLGDHANDFLKYAFDAGVRFHIGATSIDPHLLEFGFLVSDPVTHPEKVLANDTPNFLQKFKKKVYLTATGGTEQGAASAYRALSAPLINDANAGFLRDDATLGVLVVTDENDQSPRATGFYLDAFWNLKGHEHKWRFVYSAWASFSLSCPSVADDGDYAYMAARTFGETASICTATVQADLERLGRSVFGYRTTYPLTDVPDLTVGTVALEVGGVPVPPTAGGTQVWSYDVMRNAVVFNPVYVPQAGQTLEINYAVTCHP